MSDKTSRTDNSCLDPTGETWVDRENERLEREEKERIKKEKRSFVLKTIFAVIGAIFAFIIAPIVLNEYNRWRDTHSQEKTKLNKQVEPVSHQSRIQ